MSNRHLSRAHSRGLADALLGHHTGLYKTVGPAIIGDAEDVEDVIRVAMAGVSAGDPDGHTRPV